MNDLLPILYGFGELLVLILLLSILRSGNAKPEPKQDERPIDPEPLDPFDTCFDEEEPRPSRWNRQLH